MNQHVADTGHSSVAETYRPDIDGLRAVAVLAVIAFHAFPGLLPGGFIGVDIFFVISGYLISGIILKELRDGRFNFWKFYGRRVRRIFPALMAVLIASLVAGWTILLADEYAELGEHVTAGAAFVSNLVLWTESGYFDTAAEVKPLLHLWSLGIEEQFYLLWPLLLWAAHKVRGSALLIVGGVVVSFALSVHALSANPTEAFYSPLPRAWELLVGGALAWVQLQGWSRRHPRHLLSVTGAALIVAGLVLINDGTPFPSWWALLPVAGAVLLIGAGPGAVFNRLVLSRRALVWVGLISFPLYLWHWPLLTFARISIGNTPEWYIRLGLVAATFALSWVTYRRVEKPLRFGGNARSNAVGLIAAMVVVSSIGAAIWQLGGLPFRITNSSSSVTTGTVDFSMEDYAKRFPLCEPLDVRAASITAGTTTPACFQSRPGSQDIAIVGDSHALQLFTGLAGATDKNVVVYMRLGVPGDYAGYGDVIGYIEKSTIQNVVLSGYWATMTQHQDALRNGLVPLVNRLRTAGKRVLIADDVPNFKNDARACLRQSLEGACTENAARNFALHDEYVRTLRSVAKQTNAVLIDTFDAFCSQRTCSMVNGHTLYYRDANHLNELGSALVAPIILAAIQ